MSYALYNDAIVREARAAASAARLPDPDVTVTRDNPLCGDRVTLDLWLDGAAVAEVGHKTRGCMLTQAAATVVARHAPGLTPEGARDLLRDLEAALRRADGPVGAAWPELEMFGPVRQVRSRHECVLLPFQALRDALDRAGEAST
jgi:nitrogen fixation NifU-like protein